MSRAVSHTFKIDVILMSIMILDDAVDEERSPRGVRGFMLNTGEFGEWKVQGKIGGYTKCVSLFLA
jgi:hypothetical protein